MRWVVVLSLLAGCAGAPAVTHTKRVAYGPLKDVILLPLTTRSSEGVLGHVLLSDGVTPDRSRSVFRGTARPTETSQKVTVVREVSSAGRVSAGYGAVEAEVSHARVTHLAYVVEITGYAEVDPEGAFRPESDCCFNGLASDECSQGYVLRLVRGSGVVKYLQQVDSGAKLRARDYFQTNLGERFAVVDESAFTDAFFAFEPGDMYRLCETLPDDASFAPATVAPSPNCSVVSYDLEGTPRQLKKFLPDQASCEAVARHFCQSAEDQVRCAASYAGTMLWVPASSTDPADAATACTGDGAVPPDAEAQGPAPVSPAGQAVD